MACDTGFELWNFDTFNDKTPTAPIKLLFCLKFVRGRVIGKVSDLDGNPLSTDPTVVGMRVQLVTPPTDGFMTLDFRWDKQAQPLRVFMVGRVFRDQSTNQDKFDGRFHTRAGEIALTEQSLLAGPDDGDTGTGSGSQT